MSKARPGNQIPTELVEHLTPAERQQIEGLVSDFESAKSSPHILSVVISGLKSRNPETQHHWAQIPLYRYKSQLSASDFRKVVELQEDLDPEYGYSRSEIAAIRKQLADKPDTSDLDVFYEALAPDPDVEYGELLPIGFDGSGRLRWWVLPQSARRFLKGFLDLLKGTKTGEITPEAIDTFTGITGGAGRAFGPPANGATFAAGGKRRPPTEAEKQKLRARLKKNIAQGHGHEEKWLADMHKPQTSSSVAKSQ